MAPSIGQRAIHQVAAVKPTVNTATRSEQAIHTSTSVFPLIPVITSSQ